MSGHNASEGGNRRRLFENPEGPQARDLVGLAISFPKSNQPQSVQAYLQGTVGWRPIECVVFPQEFGCDWPTNLCRARFYGRVMQHRILLNASWLLWMRKVIAIFW